MTAKPREQTPETAMLIARKITLPNKSAGATRYINGRADTQTETIIKRAPKPRLSTLITQWTIFAWLASECGKIPADHLGLLRMR